MMWPIFVAGLINQLIKKVTVGFQWKPGFPAAKVLMFGHDVLLGSRQDQKLPVSQATVLNSSGNWNKWKTFYYLWGFTGRTRSETRSKGCLETEGDKRVLSGSEEEMHPIILVMKFNFRLDELFPSLRDRSRREAPVMCFSRLVPERRTSIKSPAQFHVRGCPPLAVHASDLFLCISICARGSRAAGIREDGGFSSCGKNHPVQMVPEAPVGGRWLRWSHRSCSN